MPDAIALLIQTSLAVGGTAKAEDAAPGESADGESFAQLTQAAQIATEGPAKKAPAPRAKSAQESESQSEPAPKDSDAAAVALMALAAVDAKPLPAAPSAPTGEAPAGDAAKIIQRATDPRKLVAGTPGEDSAGAPQSAPAPQDVPKDGAPLHANAPKGDAAAKPNEKAPENTASAAVPAAAAPAIAAGLADAPATAKPADVKTAQPLAAAGGQLSDAVGEALQKNAASQAAPAAPPAKAADASQAADASKTADAAKMPAPVSPPSPEIIVQRAAEAADDPAKPQTADAPAASRAAPAISSDTAPTVLSSDAARTTPPPAFVASDAQPRPPAPLIAVRVQTQNDRAHLPVEQMAVAITRQIRQGNNHFEIRLDPPELGRIDIRLEVGSDGRATAALTADRQDTLDLLSRDARGLQKALNDAGFSADQDNLRFSLRDDTQGRSRGGFDGEAPKRPPTQNAADDDMPAIQPVQIATLLEPGRLDLRV